jgi:hypothetical protein
MRLRERPPCVICIAVLEKVKQDVANSGGIRKASFAMLYHSIFQPKPEQRERKLL